MGDKSEMLRLYRFGWKDKEGVTLVGGIFIEAAHRVEAALGEELVILHEDGRTLRGTLGQQDIEVLTSDRESVLCVENLFGGRIIYGVNPLEWLK